MKKLFFLLIMGVAIWHYRADLPWNNNSSGAFNDDGSATALLFIAEDCGKPCTMIVSQLDRLHVAYESKSIHYDNRDEVAELHRYTRGANILPVLVLGERVVRGYNESELPYDVADALGLEHLPTEQANIISAAHFNADGSKKLVMYGTSWCGYCKKARELMDKEGIAYEEVDVERTGEGMRRFKVLGGGGYPLIFAGARRLSGFEAGKLRELAATTLTGTR